MNETLEALIDKHGLCAVLDSISTVCAEKADHIESNWQDYGLANQWKDHAATVNKASWHCAKVASH